jgi:hypothetical protein
MRETDNWLKASQSRQRVSEYFYVSLNTFEASENDIKMPTPFGLSAESAIYHLPKLHKISIRKKQQQMIY